ncbi:MAG TPA: transglutaminase domain-containing protein, partial [Actinomycetota bacterium]|nr:transglutaminase domain-containing protein [Actinomycetota bacterium]
VVQTFYMEAAQPNVLFAASSARQIYFPSSGLRVDTAGSIRSPILLDEGLVYSVISEVPVTDDWWLRTTSGRVPRGFAHYLQLPHGLPGRVEALASRITTDRTTLHGRVLAVQSWLQANTRYDLDIPRDPTGVEAVDHFLFETRRGYCEQIATSMAVMLRTLGIATRLVTGYGPGERNPLTGYLEVKQSDAHAWLEVFYPDIGWVQYDPTFGVPQAAPGAASRFMAGPVFAAIGRFISTVVPEPLAAAVGAMVGSVVRAGVIAIGAWPFALAVLAVATLLSFALRRRRRAGRRARTPAEAAFLELARALEPLGHERAPTMTPSEFLEGLSGDPALDHEVVAAAGTVVRTFEQERFARSKPSDADLTRAREASQRARELARRR